MRPAFFQRDLATPLALPFDSSRLVSEGGIVELRNYSEDEAALGTRDFTIHLSRPVDDLLECLRCGVEIINDDGTRIGAGYIESVEIVRDGHGYGLSIADLRNRIKATYSSNTGETNETAWVEDSVSQALYGTHERIESLNNVTAEQALQRVNVMVNQLAWPLPIPVDGTGGDGTTIYCRGWGETLNWRFYSRVTQDMTWDTTNGDGSLQSYVGLSDRENKTTASWWFAIPAGDAFALDKVKLILDPIGGFGGDSFYLSLYAYRVDDVVVWPNGTWGDVLASGELATLPNAFGWNEIPMTPKYVLQPSTTYFLVATYGSGFGRTLGLRSTTYGEDSSEGECWRNDESGHLSQGIPDERVLMGLVAVTDSTEQISKLAINTEFLTAADIQSLSGNISSAYRDGHQTELDVVSELLDAGTTNNKRLLANITPDRVIHVYEEPARTAHWLYQDEKGNFFSGEERFTRSPRGYWIRKKNLPFSDAIVVDPAIYFCERATWSNGQWSTEPRDTESPLLLGGL